MRRLRDERTDWLLSALTAVLILVIFVFAPLQLSASPRFIYLRSARYRDHRRHDAHFQEPHVPRFDVDCPCCQCCRIFSAALLPRALPLHILASAWLIVAGTLGTVVTRAVFRAGRVTYHRIIGAILLYLLIAVAFATLFLFVGLSDRDAIKGITF